MKFTSTGRAISGKPWTWRSACSTLPRLKESLRRGAGPLVLVVSDHIYWSIVSQEYDGIPRECYRPVLRVTVACRRRTGWVHMPATVARERAVATALPVGAARAA